MHVCVSISLFCWFFFLFFSFYICSQTQTQLNIFLNFKMFICYSHIHTYSLYLSSCIAVKKIRFCRFYGVYKDFVSLCVCDFFFFLLLLLLRVSIFICVFVRCVYSISIVSTYSEKNNISLHLQGTDWNGIWSGEAILVKLITEWCISCCW